MQRAVALRGLEIEAVERTLLDPPAGGKDLTQLERPELALSVLEHTLEGRVLEHVAGPPGHEPQTRFTLGHGLAESQRDRRDPVVGLGRG